ncbi:MAG: hypothetical protein AAF770_03820 [Bacteroidota bacterium]
MIRLTPSFLGFLWAILTIPPLFSTDNQDRSSWQVTDADLENDHYRKIIVIGDGVENQIALYVWANHFMGHQAGLREAEPRVGFGKYPMATFQ